MDEFATYNSADVRATKDDQTRRLGVWARSEKRCRVISALARTEPDVDEGPTYKQLAEHAGTTKETASQWARELCDMGLCIREGNPMHVAPIGDEERGKMIDALERKRGIDVSIPDRPNLS